MSDITPIDWNAAPPLQNPDPVGAFQNAFKAGKETAALSQYATDPTGAAQAIMPLNPDLALKLQANTQAQQMQAARASAAGSLAQGDYSGAASALAPTGDLENIARLNDMQKAQVVQKAEGLGAVLHGLAGMKAPDGTPATPQMRLAAAQHIAGQMGQDPSALTIDDVTDQGLAGHAATLAAMERAAMTPQERMEYDKPIFVPKDSQGVYTRDGSLSGTSSSAPSVGAASPSSASPNDRIALAKAIYTEARGEGPEGQAAVGHVVLNRVRAAGGSISDAVNAPGPFEGMTTAAANVTPQDPAFQAALQTADAVLSGQAPDPTGGATHFLNPQLQTRLGRAQPAWASGNGLRIGNHVFYGGGTPGNTAPYQVASNGPTPPPPASPNMNVPGFHFTPFAGAEGEGSGGHLASVAELKSAGLPPTASAWVDSKGKIGDVPKGIADQMAAGAAAAPDPNAPKGIAFLNTLDPQTRALVLAYDSGRAPLPTGAALRNPVIAKAFAAAAQYDPNFDGATYGARAKTRSAFTSGQPAANITAANTAIDHMATLDQDIDQLGNVQIPFVGNAFNQVKNTLSQAGGDTPIARFNAAKAAVSSELARVFQGGAPHETEVKQWNDRLNAAQSPQQLHAVVGEMATLLASRVNELGDQYNQGMGRTQDGLTLLHPTAAGTLARLGGQDGRLAEAKAAFYQTAESKGMAPPEIDAAWAKAAPHFTSSQAQPTQQSAQQQAPQAGGVRYIGEAP